MLLHGVRFARFLKPLGKMDVGDLSQFHIRQFLLGHTQGDDRKRQYQFSQMGALWDAWSALKDHVAFDLLSEICTAGREYVRQTGLTTDNELTTANLVATARRNLDRAHVVGRGEPAPEGDPRDALAEAEGLYQARRYAEAEEKARTAVQASAAILKQGNDP